MAPVDSWEGCGAAADDDALVEPVEGEYSKDDRMLAWSKKYVQQRKEDGQPFFLTPFPADSHFPYWFEPNTEGRFTPYAPSSWMDGEYCSFPFHS